MSMQTSAVTRRVVFLMLIALGACSSEQAAQNNNNNNGGGTNPPPPVVVSDIDNDGVDDSVDACPNTPANTDVTVNGCPRIPNDDDNDGIANDFDICPNTPTNEPANNRGCSASQRDSDNDGLNDNVDQCPNTPTAEIGDIDAQGCSPSERDDDNDNVSNATDQCPNTPAAETGNVNTAGCAPVELDDDRDGVNNAEDQCPATPANSTVGPDGCVLGLLPVTRTRYALNNQCFAIYSNTAEKFLTAGGNSYTATADEIGAAESFFMKPAALGSYLIYDSNGNLLNTPALPLPAPIDTVALADADDTSIFMLKGTSDSTAYPPAPQYDVEPTPEVVDNYLTFTDPNLEFSEFTITALSGQNLSSDNAGTLTLAAADGSNAAQSFSFFSNINCAGFPEASANFVGESASTLPETSFKGTTADGRVLGMTDAHVHISATTFLAKTEWGSPIHRLGVTHALDQCDEYHGTNGEQDAVGALFSGEMGGHDTTGWPTFPFWPGRDLLTHEAIYWKWLERSWQGGLRVAVNDLVDNETLCELNRNLRGEPAIDCDPMNNAGNQAGSMYAMMDYIDAQYGGRGNGWYQIIRTPEEARAVIEDGKMAVVLGIEISNLLGCQLTYNPLRTQQAFEETGTGPNENSYGCAMTETGADNEIVTQLQRLWGLGVRQIISIHEFDNAFGGNGIFDGQVLNLGNRENSGGNPGTPDPADPFSAIPTDGPETPTGEFWTTYDCPREGGLGTDGQPFSGYLFGTRGGSEQEFFSPETTGCTFMGQGDDPGTVRAGGSTPCYPDGVEQCNARWMTPIGLYMYRKLMEFGFIFDWDHMEMEMKTQALELAEAQNPPYPFVSTHGNFGGTSIDQATRLVANGGFIYPSNGSSRGFRNDMAEMRGVYDSAMQNVPEADRFLFGFGFGTDTNGLSAQSSPRGGQGDAGFRPIEYPFTMFSGGLWDQLDDFDSVTPVVFNQPAITTPDGTVTRTWHQDADGNAHHGMLADWVHEIALEGTAEDLLDLFNSAEVFLQTWERTEASSASIQAKRDAGMFVETGGVRIPADNELPRPLLRPAPTKDAALPIPLPLP